MGLALVTLIAQVESTGRTELLIKPVIAGGLAHLLQGIGDRWRGSYCLLDHFNAKATPRAPNGWEMFRVGAAKRTSRSDQPRSSGQQAANAAQR